MHKESGFTWKLGMFVITGLALLVITIYYVGKQKNIFGSTFRLNAKFKSVSGLKVGNNVRFSGINIGTVDEIDLITDTSVLVNLIIRTKYKVFIKTDALASISSDGLMGDKMLTISPGITGSDPVKDNDIILSKNAVEMDDLMSSVKVTVDNAAVITTQLAEFSYKMNNGNGALSQLISDEGFSNNLKGTLNNLRASSGQFSKFTTKMNNGVLDSTMSNIQGATKGLNENMEAAKHNILFRGFFKKKKRAEAKKLAEMKKKEEKLKKGTPKSIINLKDSLHQ